MSSESNRPSEWSRRSFMIAAGASGLGFTGLKRLMAQTVLSGVGSAGASGVTGAIGAGEAIGFGSLVPDPKGVLDLPEGFSYKIISRLGDKMADGLNTPGRPDGMAAFPGPEGKTLVVRNHEVDNGDIGSSPFGQGGQLMEKLDKSKVYDAGGDRGFRMGGTTTMVFDTRTQTLDKAYMSLAGTIRNCAGGPTPWGSWLTCEETVAKAGQAGNEKDHGYVFEVPASAEVGLVEPRPIKEMGRFNHEAVAINPESGCVYLTEDVGDSLIYRFTPHKKEDLHAGGKLEALAIRGRPSFDTRNWRRDDVLVGDTFEVEWIGLEDIDSPDDDLRLRGFHAGATRFARGEGATWAGDAVFFVCTSGGNARRGQVFRYEPSPNEGTGDESAAPGKLTLFVEPNDEDVVDMPDNICVAPWGDLVLCEDGSGEQGLVGVTPEGGLYRFARNAKSTSEFAGACFSPDGSTLFVNIQHDGLTLAVTGPWERSKS